MQLIRCASFAVLVLLLVAAPRRSAAAQASFPLLHSLFHPDTNVLASAAQGDGVTIEGNRIVVGAAYEKSGYPNAGVANVYDTGTGQLLMTLTNPHPWVSSQFGWGVTLSENHLAVGAYWQTAGATNPSRIYVYNLMGETPSVPIVELVNPHPLDQDGFGNTLSMSGTRVVVPARRNLTGPAKAGIVFVYDFASATPSTPMLTLTNPTPAVDDYFGRSVSISGNRILVGAVFDDTVAMDAGIAYLYDLASGTPTTPVLTLTKPNPAASELFGLEAVLSGTRAFVSALADASGASVGGGVYVYDLASATPTVAVLVLTNPTPAAGDRFGVSIAVSGNMVVVGDSGDDTGVLESGSVYVYDLSGATPAVPVAVLSRPVRKYQSTFGYKVAAQNKTIVVGAPWDDTYGQYGGAAYVFGVAPTLRIVPDNEPGRATISWAPAASSGFVLQYTDSFAPTNWINAASGATNPVAVPTTNSARFYRLAQP